MIHIKKIIVALLGRTNVGKSTIFNRLSLKDKAIVYNYPGVSKDRKYSDAQIGDFSFTVIDTPGLELEKLDNSNTNNIQHQVSLAILEADIICLVIDYKAGITYYDECFASILRKRKKNHVLIINKCDNGFDFSFHYQKLGFSHLAAISAEHGMGMSQLYEALTEVPLDHIDYKTCDVLTNQIPKENYQIPKENFRITICGKPNSGKSTFINALLGEDRLIVSSLPASTRESIKIDLDYKGHNLKLVDTAGLRQKSKIANKLEKLSAIDTVSSLRSSDIAILMIDAQHWVRHQDLSIARLIFSKGVGLVIAINKIDLCKEIIKDGVSLFFKINRIPVVFISALHKKNIYEVLDECIKTYHSYNIDIPTKKLNSWLKANLINHKAQILSSSRKLKIKYITQVKRKPPTFKLFTNSSNIDITNSYEKCLKNNLKKHFNLSGIPINLIFVPKKNPYLSKG